MLDFPYIGYACLIHGIFESSHKLVAQLKKIFTWNLLDESMIFFCQAPGLARCPRFLD